MKFLGIVALVGLVSANNLDSDIQAAQNLLQQNGITEQKLNNARANAQAKLDVGLKKAEKLAKQNGVQIDFSKIFNDLNTQTQSYLTLCLRGVIMRDRRLDFHRPGQGTGGGRLVLGFRRSTHIEVGPGNPACEQALALQI
jgi:hypothetical protein